jgi:hypothetical protein
MDSAGEDDDPVGFLYDDSSVSRSSLLVVVVVAVGEAVGGTGGGSCWDESSLEGGVVSRGLCNAGEIVGGGGTGGRIGDDEDDATSSGWLLGKWSVVGGGRRVGEDGGESGSGRRGAGDGGGSGRTLGAAVEVVSSSGFSLSLLLIVLGDFVGESSTSGVCLSCSVGDVVGGAGGNGGGRIGDDAASSGLVSGGSSGHVSPSKGMQVT